MRRTAPLAAALACLAVPATAAAQVAWEPCRPDGYECARLSVPLDRSGAVQGTISLALKRARGEQSQRPTAVLGIAGGPGQAALPVAAEIARAAAPALTTRDLLVFDQRGTGESGVLRCKSLRAGAKLASVARGCSAELGPRRAFYTTPDSVADIEAVRAATGYERLVIVAASYGTKVALRYAAAHPDRVEALVLDSPVLPDGPDAFRRSTMRAVGRVLSELCAGAECRGITGDVRRDIRRLAARLARRALRGRIHDVNGKARRVALDENALFRIVLGGDLNPTLRSELPAAMRAALTGDATPLLRLAYRGAGLPGGPPTQQLGADALFITTSCEETPFAWDRSATLARREQQVLSAAKKVPSSQRGPFTVDAMLRAGIVPLCLAWPVASPPPVATGPIPAVPTLVLSGRADIRTPLEDAQRIPSLVAGARVAAIPFAGHSVFGADRSGCAAAAVRAFFAGEALPPCGARDNPFSPTRIPPRSFDRVQPPRGLGGRTGRTLTAVLETILDARRQVIGGAFGLGRTPSRVGGLRAGHATVSGDTVRLRGYSYVPGVTVTGEVTLVQGAGSVRVSGRRAARGELAITSAGQVIGTLGGRGIDARARAARVG